MERAALHGYAGEAIGRTAYCARFSLYEHTILNDVFCIGRTKRDGAGRSHCSVGFHERTLTHRDTLGVAKRAQAGIKEVYILKLSASIGLEDVETPGDVTLGIPCNSCRLRRGEVGIAVKGNHHVVAELYCLTVEKSQCVGSSNLNIACHNEIVSIFGHTRAVDLAQRLKGIDAVASGSLISSRSGKPGSN